MVRLNYLWKNLAHYGWKMDSMSSKAYQIVPLRNLFAIIIGHWPIWKHVQRLGIPDKDLSRRCNGEEAEWKVNGTFPIFEDLRLKLSSWMLTDENWRPHYQTNENLSNNIFDDWLRQNQSFWDRFHRDSFLHWIKRLGSIKWRMPVR